MRRQILTNIEMFHITLLLCISEEPLLVRGAGASFPQQVYKSWASSYIAERDNINVTYRSTGSGNGQELIIEGTEVVFAGSDGLLTEEDYELVPDLQMLPFLAGGIVALAKSFEKLTFTREVLADVFLRKIEFWDDIAIAELNPNIELPHNEIIIIYREDKSGTTEVFTTALSKFSDEWAERFGATSVWPEELTQSDYYLPAQQNEGVFTLATLTPFSITYTSFTFIENSLSEEFYVRLINKAGKTVDCSPTSVNAATGGVTFSDRFTADITDSPLDNAWPISAFTYIIIRKESTIIEHCDEFWESIYFLDFGLQYYVPNLLVSVNGFATVSDDIVDNILQIFNIITCNGESRYSSYNPVLPASYSSPFYYNNLSYYTSITFATYSTFFDSIGSTIPSSEAATYDPSTIESLYNDNIIYERYYKTLFESSSSNKLQTNHVMITIISILFLYFYSRNKPILLITIICIINFSILINAQNAQNAQELRIAGFYPFTGYLAKHGSSCEAATRVSVEDINNNYLSDKNIQISFGSYDTSSDPGQGLQALNSARNNFNMFGILGCHDDLTSSSVALSSTLFLFPQISFGSRANFLTDGNNYPYFARVIPSYASDGSAIASMINIYGWENVGVIFSADDYGVGTTERFVNRLSDNVDATLIQFTPGVTTLDPQMQVLRNALVRIIVMFPSSFKDAATILKEAYRYHLIGDNFVWFGGSFTSTSELFYDPITERTNNLVKGIGRGIISVKLKSGFGNLYEEFLDKWETLNPSQFSGSGKRSLSEIAPYAYDSLSLFVRAFISGNFITLDEFLDVVKSTSFLGITGNVTLSNDGDRLGIFDIVNLRLSNEGDRGFVTVGSFYEALENGTETKGTIFEYNPVFYSGSTEIPDVEVRPSVEYWNCEENEMKINENGKIELDAPGPNADKIAEFYHCDSFIDCYNFSDESYNCSTSNYLIVFIIFGIFTGIVILINCCLVPFVIVFGYIIKRVRVRSASPPFLLIILVSIIIGCSSVYSWFGQPNAVACGFQPWLLGLPIISMIAALCAKNFRIWRIFRDPLKKKSISNFEVFIVWLVILIPGVIIIALWTLISTPTAILKEIDGREHYVCDTGGFTGPPGGYIFFVIFVCYSGFVLFIGAIISFLTRNVPSLFNESKLIAISIYNILILSIIIIPVYFVLQLFNPFVGWIIRTIAILYAFCATSSLLFVPKIVGLVKDKFGNPKDISTTSKSQTSFDYSHGNQNSGTMTL